MPIKLDTADKSLFFSKNDPQDLRLGDLAKSSTLSELEKSSEKAGWVILGYPDDEGIALNGGRPGAKEAPATIRQYLYKMTPACLTEQAPKIYDLGNLPITGALAEKHAVAESVALKALSQKQQLLTFGGGHDYGFADAAAFAQAMLTANPSEKPLVINFDAHLDVRPTDKGFHSGTPFFRLLEKFHKQIEFLEVGIQPQCNSVHHRKWAEDHGAKILPLHALHKHLTPNKKRPLWLSVDIDAFTSSQAPGCSQSFATGLEVQEFLHTLHDLKNSFSVRGMGIYEVSPPLDSDHRTSKLAALIAYHCIFDEIPMTTFSKNKIGIST